MLMPRRLKLPLHRRLFHVRVPPTPMGLFRLL